MSCSLPPHPDAPTQGPQPLQGQGGDGRGTPGQVREQARMEGPQPEQHIATVLGRVDGRLVVIQRLRRFTQPRGGQCWAVGADQQDPPSCHSPHTQVAPCCTGHACPQVTLPLVAGLQPHGQGLVRPVRVADGRTGAQLHRTNPCRHCLLQGTGQQAPCEVCRTRGPQGRDESGLHPSGDRGLGEDHNPDIADGTHPATCELDPPSPLGRPR